MALPLSDFQFLHDRPPVVHAAGNAHGDVACELPEHILRVYIVGVCFAERQC